jgi:DNA helicase HerA-like ATPase
MAEEITVVGQTNFRHQRRPFGIYTDDRRRHVYVIGKTGVGKTTLLENMIIQDVKMGRGLALIDPHGDVAEKISFRLNELTTLYTSILQTLISLWHSTH